MSGLNARKITGIVLQILIIVLGEVINVLTFRALIIPAKLLSGGVVGVALLLNQLLNLPIGLQTIIYNIPIFLLGYRYLGRRFILLSMVGVGVFSVLLDNITLLPTVTHDLLLIAVFGGVATGIADGLIIWAGGLTGGFDILGLIVSRRFGISTGQVCLK
ncbi:MAG: YitT family protein [Chloroflexota bacterium]